ncbi:diacylglycerol kinase family protein [Lacihabitans sp. LS3-19]|uniref:diacylglycerol/lipid kinase family protein n=1 Tax=Lacihabitans sp. LS3-19 TaxID=2487335 RepID=UPI0020CEA376|nr:diacylglycerol kinase family protein [Lacihabitans sp. LS3-19]
MSKQTPVFIINPIAGAKKLDSKHLIESFLLKNNLKAKIELTKEKDHGKKLAKSYLEQGYSHFVAVGGDGTINEIASQLINTGACLSIIPLGSGNGLARSLEIPMNFEDALNLVFSGKQLTIDVGLLNDRPFFCTAGVGFDAYCAEMFAKQSHGRGLWNYIKVIFRGYFNYITNVSDFCGQKKQYFSITFANANQFGNNAFIAPDAIINDNFLDCCIIGPHPKLYGFYLGYLLMSKDIRSSKYVEYFRGSTFSLAHKNEILLHIDGEYVEPFTKKIEATTIPNALIMNVKENYLP